MLGGVDCRVTPHRQAQSLSNRTFQSGPLSETHMKGNGFKELLNKPKPNYFSTGIKSYKFPASLGYSDLSFGPPTPFIRTIPHSDGPTPLEAVPKVGPACKKFSKGTQEKELGRDGTDSRDSEL